MITFKQYLEEASKANVQQKWVQKTLTLDKAIKMIEAECGDSLAAFLKGVGIFRGFSSDKLSAAIYIDSSESFRTSRDTDNLYQLAHDASVHSMHIPSRSNSLICTTSMYTAGSYATGSGFAVFPYDGTQVAISSSADYFGHPVSSTITGKKSISDVTDYLGGLTTLLGFKDSKFDDIDELDSRLSKIDADLFAFAAAVKSPVMDYPNAKQILVGVTPSGKKKLADAIRNDNYDDLSYGGTYGDQQRRQVLDLVKSGEYSFGAKFMPLFKKFKALDKNKRFTLISSMIFNKAAPGAAVASAGSAELKKKNVECWFSGECVAIRMDGDTLRKFKALLKKKGYAKTGPYLDDY